MTNPDWSLPHRPSIPQRIGYALNKERIPFLVTLTLLLGLGTSAILMLPRTYQSKSTLLIQSPLATERLSGLEDQAGIGELNTLSDRGNPLNNQVALLRSRPIYEEALKRANLTPEEAPYGNLVVAPSKDADLVTVTYVSESPELAAKVVQAVVDVYREENLRSNRQQGSAARQFLEDRLPQLAERLRTARSNLQQFQTQNGFLGTMVETDSITKSVNDFTSQVAVARSDLAATEQKLGQVRSQIPGDPQAALNATGVSQDPVYQELQKQLVTVETQLVDLQNRFTPEDPHVASATEERDRIQSLLNQRSQQLIGGRPAQSAIDPVRQQLVQQWFQLQTDRAAQAARLSQLTRQLNQLQGRSSQLPQLIERQSQLQLAVELAEQEYRTFQQQFTTSRIAEEQNLSNVRVIEPAEVDETPIAPNRKLLFALVAVVSTAAALGVVWLRRQRNTAVEEASDLNEILPLPILATVPRSGDGRLHPSEPLENQPLAHSYRLLQAHLKMLPRQMRSIAICSWLPGEGRSSVAYNLALLEAKSGHRVLLVDAHRNPLTQLQSLEFTSSKETAANSTNGHAPWQNRLYQVLPDFEVLAQGEGCSASNYKEWLVLLEQARSHYDLVILDCPAVAQDADAALLASLSDGVLWVVRPEQLGRSGIEASAQNLRTWSTRLLGQVLVGVDRPMLRNLPASQPFSVSRGLERSPQ